MQRNSPKKTTDIFTDIQLNLKNLFQTWCNQAINLPTN